MTRCALQLACLGLLACNAPVSTPHTPPPFGRWSQVPGPVTARPGFVRCVEPACPTHTPKTVSPELPDDAAQARPSARAPP